MKQLTFMNSLQKSLRWNFSSDEIKNILSIYAGFFEAGFTEGKDEKEICISLGNPKIIALQLAVVLEKRKPWYLTTCVIRRVLSSLILFIISAVYLTTSRHNIHILRDSMVYLAGTPILLWLSLGGTWQALPPVHRANKKHSIILLLAAHGVLALIIVGYFRMLWKPINGVIVYLGFLNALHPTLIIVSVLIAVCSLYGFYLCSTQYFTLMIHAIGVVVYLSALWNLLTGMDSFEHFVMYYLSYTSVYLVAVILSVLSSLVIRILSKRNHNGIVD